MKKAKYFLENENLLFLKYTGRGRWFTVYNNQNTIWKMPDKFDVIPFLLKLECNEYQIFINKEFLTKKFFFPDLEKSKGFIRKTWRNKIEIDIWERGWTNRDMFYIGNYNNNNLNKITEPLLCF